MFLNVPLTVLRHVYDLDLPTSSVIASKRGYREGVSPVRRGPPRQHTVYGKLPLASMRLSAPPRLAENQFSGVVHRD